MGGELASPRAPEPPAGLQCGHRLTWVAPALGSGRSSVLLASHCCLRRRSRAEVASQTRIYSAWTASASSSRIGRVGGRTGGQAPSRHSPTTGPRRIVRPRTAGDRAGREPFPSPPWASALSRPGAGPVPRRSSANAGNHASRPSRTARPASRPGSAASEAHGRVAWAPPAADDGPALSR